MLFKNLDRVKVACCRAEEKGQDKSYLIANFKDMVSQKF